MSTLAFYAADTVGMMLYQTKEGQLVGGEVRKIPLGPWKIDLPVDVKSDLITGQEVTAWVTIAQLKMYLIVKEKELWMLVLNSGKLDGLTLDTTPVSMRERIVQLKPAIAAVFQWKDEKWERIENAKFGD